LRFLQYLSLDVAIGSVSSALFAARALNSHATAGAYIALFFGVLCIYNFDHALDARIPGGDDRRLFQQTNRRVLLGIAIVSAALAIIVGLSLPWPMIFAGTAVGSYMVGYFVIIKSFSGNSQRVALAKDSLISIGYFAGVWGPHATSGRIDLRSVFLAGIFLFTCMLNLCGLALADARLDETRGDANLTIATSSGFVSSVSWGLLVVGLALCALSFALYGCSILLVVALVQLALQAFLAAGAGRGNKWPIRTAGEWGFALYSIPVLFDSINLQQSYFK